MTDNLARINTIAALLASAGSGRPPRHERVKLLLHNGSQSLIEAVFPPALFNPELDQAHEATGRMMEQCARQSISVMTAQDSEYPSLLNLTRENPGVLFTRGSVIADDPIVSIIGTREPSQVDQQRARNLAVSLSVAGYTVASGLATGIDTVAHLTCVNRNTRTVAVMGTAPENTYPESNTDLRHQLERNGASITQFPPGTETSAYAFPKRNITMSGLSIATIIVAASESSGTRHQAIAAIEQGRLLLITEQVAHATTWGAQMVKAGQATVISNSAHALELIRREKDQLPK